MLQRSTRLSFEALEERRLLASTPQLIDVNKAFVAGDLYDYKNVTAVGDDVYFTARDHLGSELWKSDGTLEGTVLVKDIFAGSNSSSPAQLTNVEGVLYFVTANGALWKSDGTASGTVQVSTIPGGSPTISDLTAVGDTLFFVANGDRGRELYKSDGTTEGTALVKDISPRGNSNPASLTEVNGTLYFVANDGLMGPALWKSDGTAASTVQVKDIHPDIADWGPPRWLTNVDGVLFFGAHDSAEPGEDLWKSDGTTAGTTKVKSIGTPLSGGFLQELTNVDGRLYFVVNHHAVVNGQIAYLDWQELWTSDGSDSGTTEILELDVVNYPYNTVMNTLTAVGDTLFFVGQDGSAGAELWKAQPTGAARVKDIRPGSASSDPVELVNVGGTLYFRAKGPSSQLWKSDGTEAGTTAVTNIGSASLGLYLSQATNANGTLFFVASLRHPQRTGTSLWKSDGTQAGTLPIAGTYHSDPTEFTAVGSTKFFAANDGVSGIELWKTDGTLAGTVRVKDIRPGAADSQPRELTNVNGVLYFSANDGTTGAELWRSDGTEAGTYRVKDLFTGPTSGFVANLTNVDGVLYFSGDSYETNIELWKSDGTEAGTVLVKDINPGYDGSFLSQFTTLGGVLYFIAKSTSVDGRYELWKSDGTAGGTVRLKDVSVGTHWSNAQLVNMGGSLYFAANDGASGLELWKTNGTEAGTVRVKDIIAGPAGSSPRELTEVEGVLYFRVYNGSDYELWKSDGTSAGTLFVTSGFRMEEAVNVAGVLFFSDQFARLWRSEGTAPTTQIIDAQGTAQKLTSFNGSLYFSTSRTATGRELWKTQGASGTIQLVADLFPGEKNAAPDQLTVLGDSLYFSADSIFGREVWFIKPDPMAASRGDYDDDGDADGADFLLWQRQLGTLVETAGSGADGDGNGSVGAGDLEIWKQKFGEPMEDVAFLEATPDDAALNAISQERAALDAIYAAGDFTQLFSPAIAVKRAAWRPARR